MSEDKKKINWKTIGIIAFAVLLACLFIFSIIHGFYGNPIVSSGGNG